MGSEPGGRGRAVGERGGGRVGLYLKALGAGDSTAPRPAAPARSASPFNAAYERPEGHGDIFGVSQRYRAEPWRGIDTEWLGAAGNLALQLDEHTNNTNLALAVELAPGGNVLLFPGDAQVGNWLSWDPVRWSAPDGGLTTADLLSRAVLYKVGHHGSHNATLREKGLERMTSPNLAVLIPVNRKMATQKGWRMPHPPLFDRLLERSRGRVILSDGGLPAPGGDAAVTAFVERCSETPLYVDVIVRGGN